MYCSRAHPALHSFPTRRSSDLIQLHLSHGQAQRFRMRFLAQGISAANARSEEHTSELQSHHDLVCRLLLEKKKNATYTLLDSTAANTGRTPAWTPATSRAPLPL